MDEQFQYFFSKKASENIGFYLANMKNGDKIQYTIKYNKESNTPLKNFYFFDDIQLLNINTEDILTIDTANIKTLISMYPK